MTRATIAPGYDISRVIKGGWQLAGGHGPVEEAAARADMAAFVAAGVTTFDCADIYTGVESLIGTFLRDLRARHGAAAADRVQVHTKYVPDLDALPRLQRADVVRAVDRSLSRLGVERIDLVQFHWWDYAVPRDVEVALWLDELRRSGKIRHLGLTNFDTPRLGAILDAGVQVVAHQVQGSVLDRRAFGAMRDLCRARSVQLLCYGTLAGGFLSERWRGCAAPRQPLENRSLVKYRLIIDEWGGWDRFQSLLETLHVIGRRHGVGIGAVAARAVLDEAQVAGVIVGARNAAHLAEVEALLALQLTEAERAALAALQAEAPGPVGDVYALERDKGGPHAAIMRYGLHQAESEPQTRAPRP
jgi:aryl-alcohol dehydrogenase-like predicted oxidoreductase